MPDGEAISEYQLNRRVVNKFFRIKRKYFI